MKVKKNSLLNKENFKKLMQLFIGYSDCSEKVINFKYPKDLKKEIDFKLLVNEKNKSNQELFSLLEKILKFSPKSFSPGLLNYLYSSPDQIGLFADWLSSLVNSNVHAYDASPVFSLAEIESIQLLNRKIGYSNKANGVFGPGGSYMNMLAMFVARKRHNYLDLQKLSVFTSEQSHYSIDKAAIILGINKKNIYKIKCDNRGSMDIKDLDTKINYSINRGEIPFFVNAMAGTTVLGGFDNIGLIKKTLSKFSKIWLHLDAAWGGALLFSEKHKNKMKNIEYCDSVTLDFHKSLNAPLLCAAVLIKNGGLLNNLIEVDDSYLFHDDNFDIGQKTFQCGRKADAFKFWLMWKIYGKDYFVNRISDSYKNTSLFIQKIKNSKNFLLYNEQPDFFSICFWVIPSRLEIKKSILDYSEKERKVIGDTTKSVYNLLKMDGRIIINYASVNGFPPFFRLITSNPLLNKQQVNRIIKIISFLEKNRH